MSDRHIVCPHCDTVNRISAGKPAQRAKCGKCHKALFTGEPTAMDIARFDMHIARNDIPVLVDFWADWCGPCKMMEPVFKALAAETEPEIRFLKVDTEAEPALAARYNIRSIPMLMAFRNKKVVAQQPGAMNERMLRAWIAQHVTAMEKSG